jgi:two-component system alkaline phosphatase synthesis response regulator PhoP
MQAKVLVVDDNADSVAILRGFLEARGYGVAAARNGMEALDCVRRDAFDLVLLDVMMPGMSGFDVLAEIRKQPATARLPVILLTAKTGDDDLLTGYDGGADYYITKPFTPKQLFYGIELVLEKGHGLG